MKTVIIEHPKHGRVVDVERKGNIHAWILRKKSENDGGYYVYLECDGWREVAQERDVTEACTIDPALHDKTLAGRRLWKFNAGQDIDLILPKFYHRRKVQAVVLPENWWDRWIDYGREMCSNGTTMSVVDFINWMKQYETTCLQVWEGER